MEASSEIMEISTRIVRVLLEKDHPVSKYDVKMFKKNLLDSSASFDELDPLSIAYQALIGKEDKKNLGQIYTPPTLAAFIAKLCIRSCRDHILDPSCGTGVFLAEAGKILLNELACDQIRGEQITGVEIDGSAAKIAGFNLAIRFSKKLHDAPKIVISDIFNIFPESLRTNTGDVGSNDNEGKSPLFDVIIGNPPYIRQEKIVNKEEVMEKLKKSFQKSFGNQKSVPSELPTKTADFYTYFIIYCSLFLREGGRLGMVISDKWLDVAYGKQLKRFLLNNFCLNGIISFRKGVFPGTAIDSVILLAEKNASIKQRRSNKTIFLELEDEINNEEILGMFKGVHSGRKSFPIVKALPQSELSPTEKWSRNFLPTDVFDKICAHPLVGNLSEFCDVSRGYTTGATSFFFPSEKVLRKFKIGEEFLAPAVKSPKDIEGYKTSEIPPKKILKIPKDLLDQPPSKETKGIFDYIAWGEKMEFNLRPTCSSRKKWYIVSFQNPAPIIFGYLVDRDPKFIWNQGKILENDKFARIYPHNLQNLFFLLGVLNSCITGLSLELCGRSYNLGVLDIKIFELAGLPMLDPRRVKTPQREEIEERMQHLIQNPLSSKKSLDLSVLTILGIEEDYNKIKTQIKTLRERRRNRKTQHLSKIS